MSSSYCSFSKNNQYTFVDNCYFFTLRCDTETARLFVQGEIIIKINYLLTVVFFLSACGSAEQSLTKMTSTSGGQAAEGNAMPASSSGSDTSIQIVVPKATYGNGSQELAALSYVNSRRAACGFGLLKQDSRLDAAAFAHAKYVTAPFDMALTHIESKAVLPDLFTGVNPIDRALAQAYPVVLPFVEEDFGAGYFSQANFAEVLASDLMNAPLHLVSLLRSNRDIGIGVYSSERGANSPPFRALVLNMSTTAGPQEPKGVETYPCEGSVVPGGFYGGETPDPFPGRNYASNPMGSPLAIMSRSGTALVLSGYSIRKIGDKRDLVLNLLSSSNRSRNIRSNEIVLVPESPLAEGESYEVRLAGTLDGVAWAKAFSFATEGVVK
jgi:hypothetical protein